MITLSHDDLTEDLAYLVENDVILEAINRSLGSTPNDVTLKYSCKIKDYTVPGQRNRSKSESTWVQVHFDDGITIDTRLLVSTFSEVHVHVFYHPHMNS